MTPSPRELIRLLDAARGAAIRQARRPRREIAAVLAAAAARWSHDPALRQVLPTQALLHPDTVAAGVAIAAEALTIDAMTDLAEREATPAPPQPWLVAQVVASNVPALAVPAIALGCLAGVAVVVKSGRADRVSAGAFQRALAAADAELAATVVTAYWPGGDAEREEIVLGRADRIIATGSDESVAALYRRFGARVVGFGERASIAVLGRDAVTRHVAAELAIDVALHDQRGCLSPRAVYVEGDHEAFAAELAAALDAVSTALPSGPLDAAARAAHRTAVAAAEWAGATVYGGPAGTVLATEREQSGDVPGRRTVTVHPWGRWMQRLLAGRVECVGTADVGLDLDALRALGVSRVCRPGRMQRPPLSWPRGQRPPLGGLVGTPPPRMAVETM